MVAAVLSRAGNSGPMDSQASSEVLDVNDEKIFEIVEEVEQLKLALRCSICYSTLCEPVQLPCVHAFCKECIKSSIQSSPRCPTCLKPCNRRSIVRTPYLDDVIKAFR